MKLLKKTTINSIAFLFVVLININCKKVNSTLSETKDSAITQLKVEGFNHWIVTDKEQVKLSWHTKPFAQTKEITSYEVRVSTQPEFSNSELTKTIIVPVEDGPLTYFKTENFKPRTHLFWQVRPVFKNNAKGIWSNTFNFQIGLKDNTEWQGKWIGMSSNDRGKSAILIRKTIAIDKEVKQAVLYSCGLGLHEAWLNGIKIGNKVLQPAQTDYEKRSFYVANDISSQLKKGENTLGFWIGDGFYNQDVVWGKNGLSYGQPKIIAQLEIYYKDGSKAIISTNDTWLCKPSAITASNIYAGENYNANLYDDKWASNNSNTKTWKSASILPGSGGQLIAQELPPCKIVDSIKTQSITKLTDNKYIFDFGQNLVGWAKLKVNATPNTLITLRFAEDKKSSGELNFATGGVSATKVIQTDHYICKGNTEEVWSPRFTYHGFRYAEVTITNGKLKNASPEKDLLTGMVVRTDMPIIGTFSSSNEILNKAFDMAYWTQIGSVLGVPVDCPIRERCGWTGDAHLTVPYTMYQFDASTMWQKYIKDIQTTAESERPMLSFGENFMDRSVKVKQKGLPTMIAPGKRLSGAASPDWGSAIAFIPWDLYLHTGDTRPLENSYDSIKTWITHLETLEDSGIINVGLGDWCKPILENPNNLKPPLFYGEMVPLLSTACYYRSARIAADTANLLGKTEDFKVYDALANRIRKAFTEHFYSEDSKLTPDQTVNAIAVDWDVLPPELHAKTAETLNNQLIDANYHFMTGVFGMPSLWSVLGNYGYHETIQKILENDSAPSIKHLIDQGATTFWEVWPLENENLDNYSRSMSHPFQGAFVRWFYSGLAGIKPDTNIPGYKLIHLEPQIIPGLQWVNCTFESPMGLIESSWKKTEAIVNWKVQIPLGTKAILKIPGERISIEKVIEEGKTMTHSNFTTSEDNEISLNQGVYNIVFEQQ